MGFKFSSLVELLEDLERNRFRKASNASKSVNPDHAIIVQWFNRHDAKIKRTQDEGLAFLSCLFPERRPDRSFHMQEARLASLFGRVYQLGTARLNELRAWKERKPADFPSCLASVLAQTEMPEPQPGSEIMLEEINDALDDIAANVKSSTPSLRVSATFSDAVETLTPILYRLQSTEAKWLVRILLKSYHPVQIPEVVTMQQFHFLLPELLAIQNDLGAAMATLNQAEIMQLPKRISKAEAIVLKTRLAGHLTPKIGVMIKRQAYHKARSIKHCCQTANREIMSVEQKYDGEYCQIHIDMSKHPSERIQIFSKSGRDSTQDRIRLHYAIEASLNLQSRSQQCRFKNQCILEGELLIYSRSSGTIQPFHKIRKHIQHGGRFLNHEADSPIALYEQVMIMYYDILLLDHINLLERPQEERRRRLEHLIAPTKGLAEIGVRHILDFRSRKAPDQLREIFASCITQRFEGFVIKSCKDPYFSCTSSNNGIKLKKDYIKRLGDIADFALIGARLDTKTKRNLGHSELKWNSFFMGCLENKDQVIRFDSKPTFRVIGEVSFMPENDMEYLNTRGESLATPFTKLSDHMNVSMDPKQGRTPEVLFKTPFVVEVLGSGYERAPNATYWALRHPRLHKIHGDRSIIETVSFDELQEMAKFTQTAPIEATSQEDREWIEKLERADSKSIYINDRSQSTVTTPGRSPGSTATASRTPLRTVIKSPLFTIWNDASQLPKVANKVLSQEGSSPIRTETRSTMKRSCNEEAEMLRRNKRRQVTPRRIPGSTEGATWNSSSHTLGITSAPFDEARAVGRSCIKKTPPWCRPSSSASSMKNSPYEPPAVFRVSPDRRKSHQGSKSTTSGSSRPIREPLTEVAQPSTALNAASHPRFSQDLRRSRQQGKSAPAMSTPRPNTSMQVKSTSVPLPTPPSSAEEIVKPQQIGQAVVAHGTSSKEPGGKPHQLPPQTLDAPGTAQDLPTATQLSSPPSPPHPPLLLTPSLHLLPEATMKRTLDALWSADASLTPSAVQFVTHVPFHAVTIALLDITAAPAEIANTMRDIMNRLLAVDVRKSVRRDGRVFFLDWRSLETSGSGEDLRQTLGGSRRHFAGCLKWTCNDRDDNAETTKMILTVTACFDWNEAISI